MSKKGVDFLLTLAVLLLLAALAGLSPSLMLLKESPSHLHAAIEKKLDSFQDILDSFPRGNIAYNVPPTMSIDKPSGIHLLLSPNIPLEDLEEKLELRTQTDEGLASTVIHISPMMEAHLSGDKFSIVPVTPEKQGIAAKSATEWQWEVTPKRGGKQQLHLTLSALISIDNEDVERAVRTFDKTIEVEVSMPRRAADFLRDNWTWLAGVGSLILAGIAWLRKGRSPKPPPASAPAPTTPPVPPAPAP
jgi:hypothetical protein